MRALKRLFGFATPPVRLFEHPALGALRYDTVAGEWETVASPIYHGGISGSSTEPDEARVAEVLQRVSDIAQYWQACEPDLRYIADQHPSLPRSISPQAFFRVAALSLYPNYWELCFETVKPHKWLYVGMQFEGDRLVSNTIDS